eukprot:364779_1
MSHLSSLTVTILHSILLIPSSIFILIAMKANVNLYTYRNKQFMKKRQFWKHSAVNTLIILTMMAHISLYGSLWLHPINCNMFLMISAIIAIILWCITLFALNATIWIQYAHYKWKYFSLQYEWQKIINPHFPKQNSEQNAFIRNYTKYKSISFCCYTFGISHLFVCIVFVCTSYIRIYYYNHIDHVIYIIVGFIGCIIMWAPIIIYHIITHNTPSVDDTFSIHWENKIRSKLCIFLYLIFTGNTITFSFFRDYTYTHLIFIGLKIFILFAIVYASTCSIIFRNKNNDFCDVVQSHIPRQNKNKSIGLDAILSNSKALNFFMQHLAKECNLECLTSYIEFDQFQKFALNALYAKQSDCQKPVELSEIFDGKQLECTDTNDPNIDDIYNKQIIQINHMKELSNIPLSVIVDTVRSSIICDTSDIEQQILADAKTKAFELFQKYININSAFEINISWNMRLKFMNIFEDKYVLRNRRDIHLNTLILLFEEPKQEMKSLLQHPFQRFKQTKNYQKI